VGLALRSVVDHRLGIRIQLFGRDDRVALLCAKQRVVCLRALTRDISKVGYSHQRRPAAASQLKSYDGGAWPAAHPESAGELHYRRVHCPSEQQMEWSDAQMDRPAMDAETAEATTGSCGRLRSGSHGDSKALLCLTGRLEKGGDRP
jgi:hypothetical protein